MQCRKITSNDAERFLAFRAEGLGGDPGQFRVTEADDEDLGIIFWRQRLDRDHVVAVERDGVWIGIGGLQRLAGEKLRHKALIWGMYVDPHGRGSGAADLIIQALMDEARRTVRQVQLTVMADNARAIRFYERHGFVTYGIEPASVRRGNTCDDEALMWHLFDAAS